MLQSRSARTMASIAAVVRWTSVLVVAVLVFAVTSGVTGLSSQHATAQAAEVPFSCTTPTIFDSNGNPNTALDAQYQSSSGSSFTQIGSPATGSYNAIGYNTADNLIYGIGTGGNQPLGSLVVVDATGTVTVLGAITGFSSTDTGFFAGGFDAAGNYYVVGSQTGTLYRVDLTTRVATPVPLSSSVSVLDITYTDGYFWGINQNTNTLVRIDPTTGAVNFYSLTSLGMPVGLYGAAWTYGNGNLGFDINTGGVYQISIANASGTPTFTLVSQSAGPASTINDGTSCVPGPVDLGIAKTGPANVVPGGTVTWTLTVHNYGPNISSGFNVTDAVPAGYTNVATTTTGCSISGSTVSCLGGTLAVGADYTITLTAKAPTTAGCITNTASVLGNEADPNSANNTSSFSTCVGQPAIGIVKTASPSTVTAAGQTVTYSFVVTNTGAVTLTNVGVTDVFTQGGAGTMSAISCPSTTLAVGASETCTATYVTTAADVSAGGVKNTATATGTGPTGATVTAQSSATVAVGALTLVKSASPSTVTAAGQTVTYSFVVTNTGSAALTNVGVTDAFTQGGAGTMSAISCPSTTLAVGASTTCTATYVTTAADISGGGVKNTATATGTTPAGQSVRAQSSAAVTVAALTMVKSASPSGVTAAGQTVTYSFLVTNTGSTTLSGVAVTDTGFSGTGTLSAVNCPTTTLAPGASTTCTATYTVTQADVNAGSISNTATASGTSPSGTTATSPPSSATVTAIQGPALTVVKSASPATVTAAGQTVTYSFLVTNTGNVTLTRTKVVDTMPGLSAITCPVTTLQPSTGETCTATYTVTQADIDAGSITNTAVTVAVTRQGSQVTSGRSKVVTEVAGGLATSVAASVLAFTGLPAVQIVLVALLAILLGAVFLAARRRLSNDEPEEWSGHGV